MAETLWSGCCRIGKRNSGTQCDETLAAGQQFWHFGTHPLNVALSARAEPSAGACTAATKHVQWNDAWLCGEFPTDSKCVLHDGEIGPCCDATISEGADVCNAGRSARGQYWTDDAGLRVVDVEPSRQCHVGDAGYHRNRFQECPQLGHEYRRLTGNNGQIARKATSPV